MRRWLTIPAVLVVALVLVASAPLWLTLATAVSIVPGFRGLWRFLSFITVYLCCETIGILLGAWYWLQYQNPRPNDARWSAYLERNYRLQCWWANSLKRAAERIYALHFRVTGEDALQGSAAIMLPRHASIGDTVVPVVWYCIPQGVRLRYVLKKELLFDPCLDIVGNRLPNYFVDRFSDDPRQEIAGVAALLNDICDREGVLIYPEGTRYSDTKRARLLQRFLERGDLDAHGRLLRWYRLLPPRLGGTLALLQSNPGRDVIFCAHSGFEGSATFAGLLSGGWIGAQIRIHFWRVPFASIPTGEDQQRDWLFAQWDRMAETLKGFDG